jgi:hypothetical protein
VALPQKRTAAVTRRAQTRPNLDADSTGAAAISCVKSPNTLHKITAKMAKTLALDQNDENQSKNSQNEVKKDEMRQKSYFQNREILSNIHLFFVKQKHIEI